jgi:mannitol-1-phosphate 5-dehydrogenase
LGVEKFYTQWGNAMCQAADILIEIYPTKFTKRDLKEDIEDLLFRFSNQALGDTVYRVGQDLYRKLGPEDRVVGAIKMGIKNSMPYDKILKTSDYALRFQARDEQGYRTPDDIEFFEEASKGKSYILNKVCGLSEHKFPDVHIQLARSDD